MFRRALASTVLFFAAAASGGSPLIADALYQTGSAGSQNSSQKILDAVFANPAITTLELANVLGISRRAVAKHMAALQSSGCLRRIGPDKGGHWEVIAASPKQSPKPTHS